MLQPSDSKAGYNPSPNPNPNSHPNPNPNPSPSPDLLELGAAREALDARDRVVAQVEPPQPAQRACPA